MKKLWIISGVIAVTLVIALGQFETKVPENWGLCSLYFNQQKLWQTGMTVERAQFNLGCDV